jgi:surfeit locus 1 family protein
MSIRGWAVPTVAALVGAALCCTLAVWQLRRADEKRVLQAEYDRRTAQAPVRVDAELRSADTLSFHRVEVRGTYDTGHQVLLDNRVHQGVPGYHVLTPLRIEGGDTRVLVNRGWVPAGPDRAHRPAVAPPPGVVTIRGVATVPRPGWALAEPPPLAPDGPVVWAQFELAHYAASVPFVLQPVVILLDPDSPAGGYRRAWTRLDGGIAVHQGYAFQWFALAAAVIMVYIVLTARAARRKGGLRWR